MKALGFCKHGELEVITLLDLPTPKPGRNEVLVEVKASSFNHLDIWVRKGWPGLKLQLPHICGSDAAGVVVEVGENVTDIKIGNRVCVDPGISLSEDEFTASGEDSLSPRYAILGEHLPGTHAEYLVVPEKNILRLPDNISYEVAAACGLVGATTWRMLINRAKIKVGESILVIGAGGGVNSIAIQLAKLAGCKVFAITSSEEKVIKAKELGADFVIDYKSQKNWAQQLLKLTNHKGFDVVVDNVGKATLNQSIQLVKPGGRIVIVGNTSGPIINLDIRAIFGKQISIIGSTMGSHFDYKKIMQLVFDEKIKPVIHTSLPLNKGIEGMAMLEEGAQFGKIMLTR